MQDYENVKLDRFVNKFVVFQLSNVLNTELKTNLLCMKRYHFSEGTLICEGPLQEEQFTPSYNNLEQFTPSYNNLEFKKSLTNK